MTFTAYVIAAPVVLLVDQRLLALSITQLTDPLHEVLRAILVKKNFSETGVLSCVCCVRISKSHFATWTWLLENAPWVTCRVFIEWQECVVHSVGGQNTRFGPCTRPARIKLPTVPCDIAGHIRRSPVFVRVSTHEWAYEYSPWQAGEHFRRWTRERRQISNMAKGFGRSKKEMKLERGERRSRDVSSGSS